MLPVNCPKCNFKFNLEENMKFKIGGIDDFINLMIFRPNKPLFAGNEILEKGDYAICPSCGYEVKIEHYKFFGFLPLYVLRIVLIACLILIIAISIYFAFR